MGNSFLIDRQEEHRFVRKKSGHILLFPLFLLSFFIVSCDDKYEDLRYEYSDYGIIHKNGELTTIQTDREPLYALRFGIFLPNSKTRIVC